MNHIPFHEFLFWQKNTHPKGLVAVSVNEDLWHWNVLVANYKLTANFALNYFEAKWLWCLVWGMASEGYNVLEVVLVLLKIKIINQFHGKFISSSKKFVKSNSIWFHEVFWMDWSIIMSKKSKQTADYYLKYASYWAKSYHRHWHYYNQEHWVRHCKLRSQVGHVLRLRTLQWTGKMINSSKNFTMISRKKTPK